MSGTSFLALFQNTALLLAAALVFDVAASRWRTGLSLFRQMPVGFALGAIGIAVMLTPWTLSPGIVFDVRSILIGISGLFFGTLATLVAMAMTAAFRFHQGGAGVWTGITVILVSGLIGIAWRHYGRRPREEISWRELYLFGMAVHLAMLAAMLTLPWEVALRVLSSIALPVLLIYPAGTALLGVLMVNRLRRERAEEALQESRNQYRLLADNVSDVIFVLDMNLNYTYVSPSVKILRGYEPAEVLKQPAMETLTPSSGDVVLRTAAEALEAENSGQADISASRTLELEMRRKDGTTVWTEVKLSFIRDEKRRAVGILGVTRDIMKRRRSEERLQQTLESLRKAFSTTVQVMVSAVEARDPYTAGHQLRSADLARAIATEMGLPRETIDGIRMAGSIHDIGKLSIPAELLSKPTKLTDLEFSLIKDHSRSGYEILRNVESPWPLAQIVYQHHERMDGSGYPRNLKGDDILMEARILAVSDVVESMASHRPYRPALGLEAALGEIEKNRGILYDDAIADACLRLFREKGYQLH